MIGVIDCNLGNIGSVVNMINKIGGEAIVSAVPEDLKKVDKLILPGVGKFDYGMNQLQKLDLIAPLNKIVLDQQKPILGICLGMQMICNGSEEGNLKGLSWVDAEVRMFSSSEKADLKIPHMGWNTIEVVRNNPLIPMSEDERRFYFVHSYKVMCNDPTDPIASAEYGGEFTAAFNRGNIFGVQFHPEKSHRFGLELMKRFLEI